jgi:hypothetical protein
MRGSPGAPWRLSRPDDLDILDFHDYRELSRSRPTQIGVTILFHLFAPEVRTVQEPHWTPIPIAPTPLPSAPACYDTLGSNFRSEPFYAQLDTGASETNISQQLAQTLGLLQPLHEPYLTPVSCITGSGDNFEITSRIRPVVDLYDTDGRGTTLSLPMNVMPISSSASKQDQQQILLGHDALSLLHPTLDYLNSRVVFSEGICRFCFKPVTAPAAGECGHFFDFQCAMEKCALEGRGAVGVVCPEPGCGKVLTKLRFHPQPMEQYPGVEWKYWEF